MRRARIGTAALLAGIGLSGLFDGIVFHRILHWHGMLSAALPPESAESVITNMRADGWFDFGMWLLIVIAAVTLWSAFRAPGRAPSGQSVIGQVLLGWGAFNVIEGLINHFILQTHHVRDLPVHMPVYDWVFLALAGILPVMIGLALRDKEPAPLFTDRRSGVDRRLESMLQQ